MMVKKMIKDTRRSEQTLSSLLQPHTGQRGPLLSTGTHTLGNMNIIVVLIDDGEEDDKDTRHSEQTSSSLLQPHTGQHSPLLSTGTHTFGNIITIVVLFDDGEEDDIRHYLEKFTMVKKTKEAATLCIIWGIYYPYTTLTIKLLVSSNLRKRMKANGPQVVNSPSITFQTGFAILGGSTQTKETHRISTTVLNDDEDGHTIMCCLSWFCQTLVCVVDC